MNVAIFFSNLDAIDVSITAGVNITKVATIKPCMSDKNVQQYLTRLMREDHSKECNCVQILTKGIVSLLNCARNSLKMATAVIRITLKSFENEKSEKTSGYHVFSPNVESLRRKNNSVNTQLHKKTKYIPPFKILTEDEDDNGIIIMNSYSHRPTFKLKNSKNSQFLNIKRNNRDNDMMSKTNQNVYIDLKSGTQVEKQDSIWDLLGLIAATKGSFFITFVNPMLDTNEKSTVDDGLGTKPLSLSKAVATLVTHMKKAQYKQGLVLIVYGGDISMLKNENSELVQSIRCFSDNLENPLVVITGDCPTDLKKRQKIPLFVKGPEVEKFKNITTLCQVPKTVLEILEENSSDTKKRRIANLVREDGDIPVHGIAKIH
ncbi:hypothetical protein FQA39_LY18069 [Lamprigera yunnana]|nr:hypothetical protein FQA39_LY18069 [Lamprigera yunnana]